MLTQTSSPVGDPGFRRSGPGSSRILVLTVLLLVVSSLFMACGWFANGEPTALTRAIDDQDVVRVTQLLDGGADPNQRGLLYPLEIAAARESVEILKVLLAHGAVPEKAVDKSTKWSPLFAAAQDGVPEAIQILLNAGSDPCARTSASWAKGLRPSEVARQRKNDRVIPLLESVEVSRCPA